MSKAARIIFEDSASRTYKDRSAEERDLFRRIVDDCDGDAFAIYLDKNKANLVHFAKKYCKSLELAEDVLMDATLKCIEKQAKKKAGHTSVFCDDARNFDTWFHTVIKNHSFNLVRGVRHLRTETGYDTSSDHVPANGYGQNYQPDFSLSNALGELSDGFEDPLLYHLKHEREAAISETLNWVLERGKTSDAFNAAILYGQTDLYQTVADETGVPIGTVRSRIHKARSDLKRHHSVLEPIEAF